MMPNKICKNCRFWAPEVGDRGGVRYGMCLGKKVRRHQVYDKVEDDTCEKWEEKNNQAD